MILHSIVSPSDIFCNTGMRKPQTVCRRIDGGLLELRGGRVERLISTDPRLYLDRRYYPYTPYK